MKPYEKGNRLSVPSEQMGSHFMYHATVGKVDEADLALVVSAAKACVAERGLTPAQIDTFRPIDLESAGFPDARNACDRMLAALGLPNAPEGGHAKVTILACEWASPHVDDTFAGLAFMNFVLHTGPSNYVAQTLHTTVKGSEHPFQDIVTNSRVLSVGDCLIFDPTTAHFAMPIRPHQDSLLILMQVELPDNTAEERAQILAIFPPVEGDKDKFHWSDAETTADNEE